LTDSHNLYVVEVAGETEKQQIFVGDFITGEIWTAGEMGLWDPEWKSRKSEDTLKRNLYWNRIYAKKKGCVYLELFNDTKSRQDDPRLGMADCDERKKFICEVK
jgi:hypothetical protein